MLAARARRRCARDGGALAAARGEGGWREHMGGGVWCAGMQRVERRVGVGMGSGE